MGRMKPRIIAVALPPWGVEYKAEHDRSKGEVWVQVNVGRARVRLHKAKNCAGEYCCLHRPSDHPLKDAPMILRMDRGMLIERVCEHGTGHSDPDSVAFLASTGSKDDGTHGCDGCCTEEGLSVPLS